jgi:hypothetical protein
MPPPISYRESLKQDLGELIAALDLSELQKHFLRSRWLDQVVWMEGRADKARDWYYRLRLTTIIGGLIIPALVSLSINSDLRSILTGTAIPTGFVPGLTFCLSLVVAISAALEEFFHYGERWRHYRRTVELLKIEGWQFFQLSGPYRRHKSHAEAYPSFAARTEDTIQRDVDVYIAEVVREKEEERDGKAGHPATAG